MPSGHTVGVLLMTNFGELGRLTVDGVRIGRTTLTRLRQRRRCPTRAKGVVHRGGRNGRTDRPRRVRALGAAGWTGAGTHRLDGTSRQRRDLHGVRDGAAAERDKAPAVPPLMAARP